MSGPSEILEEGNLIKKIETLLPSFPLPPSLLHPFDCNLHDIKPRVRDFHLEHLQIAPSPPQWFAKRDVFCIFDSQISVPYVINHNTTVRLVNVVCG